MCLEKLRRRSAHQPALSDIIGRGRNGTRLVPAAVGNAVFDATGVWLRRVPFTPTRVKAALDKARRPASHSPLPYLRDYDGWLRGDATVTTW